MEELTYKTGKTSKTGMFNLFPYGKLSGDCRLTRLPCLVLCVKRTFRMVSIGNGGIND